MYTVFIENTIDSILVCCKIESEVFITGNPTPAGLAMKYKDSCGEMQLIKMAVSSQMRKEGQFWITSMLKVLRNYSNINNFMPSGLLYNNSWDRSICINKAGCLVSF